MRRRCIYTLLKPSVSRDEVWEAGEENGWNWWDEHEADENSPYELVWVTNDLQTTIHYVSDHLFGIHYFWVEGPDAPQIVAQIRETLDAYTEAEILRMAKEAERPEEHGSAILHLGIAAPADFDAQFFELFKKAFAHCDLRVRDAAIWATGYVDWPSVRVLVEKATFDPELEVRKTALVMLEAYDKVG